MTTYEALSQRIKQASTVPELQSRDKQIVQHYNNLTISEAEFKRLDSMILERIIKLEHAEP